MAVDTAALSSSIAHGDVLHTKPTLVLRASNANVEVIVVIGGVPGLVKQRGGLVDVLAKSWAGPGEREQPLSEVARDEDVLDVGAVVLQPKLHEEPVSVIIEDVGAAVARLTVRVERHEAIESDGPAGRVQDHEAYVGVPAALVRTVAGERSTGLPREIPDQQPRTGNLSSELPSAPFEHEDERRVTVRSAPAPRFDREVRARAQPLGAQLPAVDRGTDGERHLRIRRLAVLVG